MKLSVLAKAAQDYVLSLHGDCDIACLQQDSRKPVEAGLFFCISGLRFDAHQFAAQAIKNGAVALVVTVYQAQLDVPQVVVSNDRAAMALMAGAFYGYPHRRLRMVGITGTKGKTTTSYMVKSILEAAGLSVGLIGTTGHMIGEEKLAYSLTTPDPIELHSILRLMVDRGVQAVVMEVSAHALAMHRLLGVEYEVGCFTNFSQDHLDFFGDMDTYFEAKKRFFTSGMVQNAVYNVDSDRAAELREGISVPCTSYGISANADIFARDIEITENGVRFQLSCWNEKQTPVQMRLMGLFNVYNALAASAICLSMGIAEDDIAVGIAALKAVPGRAEMLETNTDYKILLDYSHSPDAMENILRTVRDFVRSRIILVFGCGGDRDKGKRPIMGEIAGRMADFTILTSDNPRTENPDTILAEIENGMKKTAGKYTVVENRREAIEHAMTMAKDGDIIILAGKGDETYQEIAGVKRPFNEKQIVAEILSART